MAEANDVEVSINVELDDSGALHLTFSHPAMFADILQNCYLNLKRIRDESTDPDEVRDAKTRIEAVLRTLNHVYDMYLDAGYSIRKPPYLLDS